MGIRGEILVFLEVKQLVKCNSPKVTNGKLHSFEHGGFGVKIVQVVPVINLTA